ncbi:hypothetical protein BJP34_23270 [Moorena producens PAL-8-15-08-1]|uniref:Uncharacterized protein n=2 Tax=Moorena TaxID=1155738 RepID=A0A1D8TWD2_9CYAN|nr:hypothetical protein BJP34_23270 [Moorena producens PAL-8-15-08-1]
MRSAVQGADLLLAWAFRVLLRHDWDLGMGFGKADPTGTHLFLSPLIIAVLIVTRYTGFFPTSDFPTPYSLLPTPFFFNWSHFGDTNRGNSIVIKVLLSLFLSKHNLPDPSSRHKLLALSLRSRQDLAPLPLTSVGDLF